MRCRPCLASRRGKLKVAAAGILPEGPRRSPTSERDVLPPITDWNDAYANGAHIDGAEAIAEAWPRRASDLRDRFPPVRLDDRRSDLFLPQKRPAGLLVFVHGGYWQQTDARTWSHLAGGALARGRAALVAGYELCPRVRIEEIVDQVAAAIEAAAGRVEGPIVLAGHSAGGHLVAMMNARGAPLADDTFARIDRTVAISGLGDLRPLVRTRLNDALRLDESEAARLSPILLHPRAGTRLTCWVGAAERPEFLRQSRLLADMWRGLGAATRCVVEDGRHHFDVIDGLADPASPLMHHLLEETS